MAIKLPKNLKLKTQKSKQDNHKKHTHLAPLIRNQSWTIREMGKGNFGYINIIQAATELI